MRPSYKNGIWLHQNGFLAPSTLWDAAGWLGVVERAFPGRGCLSFSPSLSPFHSLLFPRLSFEGTSQPWWVWGKGGHRRGRRTRAEGIKPERHAVALHLQRCGCLCRIGSSYLSCRMSHSLCAGDNKAQRHYSQTTVHGHNAMVTHRKTKTQIILWTDRSLHSPRTALVLGSYSHSALRAQGTWKAHGARISHHFQAKKEEGGIVPLHPLFLLL